MRSAKDESIREKTCAQKRVFYFIMSSIAVKFETLMSFFTMNRVCR